MEQLSQIAWKIVPLRHFFPLMIVPLIEDLLLAEFRVHLLVRAVNLHWDRAANLVWQFLQHFLFEAPDHNGVNQDRI
jgi:hypothetical protein